MNHSSRKFITAITPVIGMLVVICLFAASAPLQGTIAPTTIPTVSVKDTAQTYEIDDTHSMALFRVQHLGAGAFWGLFNDVSGTVRCAPDAELFLDVTINADSVDSNNAKLDRHLKSPDFFNTKEFPTMSFRSVSAKPLGGGKYLVTGDLTIRGITKSITTPVECTGIADMGSGARAGFEAVLTIKRSDFGVQYGVEKKMIGDETRIIVAIEGVQAKAANDANDAKPANDPDTKK